MFGKIPREQEDIPAGGLRGRVYLDRVRPRSRNGSRPTACAAAPCPVAPLFPPPERHAHRLSPPQPHFRCGVPRLHLFYQRGEYKFSPDEN